MLLIERVRVVALICLLFALFREPILTLNFPGNPLVQIRIGVSPEAMPPGVSFKFRYGDYTALLGGLHS
jgi:hypothetical protein